MLIYWMIFFCKICHLLCARISVIYIPANITGSAATADKVRYGLTIIIITSTTITVRKSGRSCVTVLCITSLSELTSPITLERILPVGLLSKKLKT